MAEETKKKIYKALPDPPMIREPIIREKEFNCNNCQGKVERSSMGGWKHIIATGCLKPAVSMENWRKYSKCKKKNLI